MPSQMNVEHTWRTRTDPFEEHWPQCEGMLSDAPELEGKFLFEWLCEQYPGEYQEGQLRTFQRRVQAWRALKGPERRRCFFPRSMRPL